MQIIDLEEKYNDLYFMCLEDWSDEMKEAGGHKDKCTDVSGKVARWVAEILLEQSPKK